MLNTLDSFLNIIIFIDAREDFYSIIHNIKIKIFISEPPGLGLNCRGSIYCIA